MCILLNKKIKKIKKMTQRPRYEAGSESADEVGPEALHFQ